MIHKESLCINCGCCVSECNAMESDPEFLGPQALAKGMRFVGDPRDGATVERLEQYSDEHGIWDCTRCYFCNERCPKGVDPRDAIAKLGAEAIKARHRPRHGREAREVVRPLGGDDRLAAREGARPEDAGRRLAIKQMKFAMNLARHGKAALAFPPHVAKDVGEARNLRKLVREQDREGALGHVQGEHGARRLEHGHVDGTLEEIYATPGRVPAAVASRTSHEETEHREASRVLQGLPRVAVREGAGHVDAGARAARRARARSSSSRSPAAAPATSTRRSPTTTST